MRPILTVITDAQEKQFLHLCYHIIITIWRGITCRIAVTIEGVENAYLPWKVHFQYRPIVWWGSLSSPRASVDTIVTYKQYLGLN